MPHQQHPSSLPLDVLTQGQQIEFLLLAEFASNARQIEKINDLIMSGEAEIVGMKTATSIPTNRKSNGYFPSDADDSIDYTISNPDTLTKYKTAAQITHKVLETVTGNKASMNPKSHPRF